MQAAVEYLLDHPSLSQEEALWKIKEKGEQHRKQGIDSSQKDEQALKQSIVASYAFAPEQASHRTTQAIPWGEKKGGLGGQDSAGKVWPGQRSVVSQHRGALLFQEVYTLKPGHIFCMLLHDWLCCGHVESIPPASRCDRIHLKTCCWTGQQGTSALFWALPATFILNSLGRCNPSI